jgi:hypothetical protein
VESDARHQTCERPKSVWIDAISSDSKDGWRHKLLQGTNCFTAQTAPKPGQIDSKLRLSVGQHAAEARA